MPPYLAGRTTEYAEFDVLLAQEVILENLVLTGLRGLGKTVLLETLRPRAQAAGWLWAGTDLSESASISELNMATRLITDLSVVTSTFTVTVPSPRVTGFAMREPDVKVPVGFDMLQAVFQGTPGLIADKLKAVLRLAHEAITENGHDGRLIFAYDEAQNLSDHAGKEQYPLSILLDVFQSIQRSGVNFMLALTGLPTLFPKLVEARTYAERMFRVVILDRLNKAESREAIVRPLDNGPLTLRDESIDVITNQSGGYPYFIQFICREAFDVFLRQVADEQVPSVPIDAIQRKLDSDFFAGRWSKVTDRQRQLLFVAASLESREEFSLQDLVTLSKQLLKKGFTSSHANQILSGLTEHGLIYKNRFGRYSFAVPLLDQFILRTLSPNSMGESNSWRI